MKISSKSILSPGRPGVRDPLTSLSTSLSRRLRNSGSIKGGASPAMFPTAAKKRGGGFENNPEPSSPKVTCIGQVRVRSKKKQAKKLRTLSRRHSAGEVSFRKLEHEHEHHPLHGFPSQRSLDLGSKAFQNHHENQDSQRRWVHFPMTVCDALRAFGSEFSCLFPCRKEEKTVAADDGSRQGSCGAVFARWLVAVQDGDGGGERDIELVVGDEEEEEESVRKTRRHVFEDLEIVNDRIEGHKDEARVSTCIPPKNALLLMRCRSDPVKIEALTNRSWEPNVVKTDEEDEHVDNEDQIQQVNHESEPKQVIILDQHQENVQQDAMGQDQESASVQKSEVGQDQDDDNLQQYEVDQEQDNVQKYDLGQDQCQEHNQIEAESFNLGLLFVEIVDQDYEIQEHDEPYEETFNLGSLFEKISETHEEEMVNDAAEDCKNGSDNVLPECLLMMMMYEPKLSMEVSKETWVRRTDFIQHQSSRRRPPPPPLPPAATAKHDGEDESGVSATATAIGNDVMRVGDGGLPAVIQQPGRSSFSSPAVPATARVLYEPFVLTRCKSEPMKTASSKLVPESCVLENRKVERLSRGRFGVGAAGLGF